MNYDKPESIQVIENTSQKLVFLFQHETSIVSSLVITIFYMIPAFIALKLLYHSFKSKSSKNSWFGILFEKTLIYFLITPVFFLFSLYFIILGVFNLTDSSYECQVEVSKKSINILYKNLRLESENKSTIDISKAKQLYVKKEFKTYSLYFLDSHNREKEVKLLFGGHLKAEYLYICQEIEKFLKIKDNPIEEEIK